MTQGKRHRGFGRLVENTLIGLVFMGIVVLGWFPHEIGDPLSPLYRWLALGGLVFVMVVLIHMKAKKHRVDIKRRFVIEAGETLFILSEPGRVSKVDFNAIDTLTLAESKDGSSISFCRIDFGKQFYWVYYQANIEQIKMRIKHLERVERQEISGFEIRRIRGSKHSKWLVASGILLGTLVFKLFVYSLDSFSDMDRARRLDSQNYKHYKKMHDEDK